MWKWDNEKLIQNKMFPASGGGDDLSPWCCDFQFNFVLLRLADNCDPRVSLSRVGLAHCKNGGDI